MNSGATIDKLVDDLISYRLEAQKHYYKGKIIRAMTGMNVQIPNPGTGDMEDIV